MLQLVTQIYGDVDKRVDFLDPNRSSYYQNITVMTFKLISLIIVDKGRKEENVKIYKVFHQKDGQSVLVICDPRWSANRSAY